MAIEEEILAALQKDFYLSIPETINEYVILQLLKLKISELLHGNAETFFQMLYRLDIPEQKTKLALLDNEHAIDNLALLIYERQLQKAISRTENKQTNFVVEDDLIW